MHVWQVLEYLFCRRAGLRKNDFASSLKSDDDPISSTPMRSDADLVAIPHGVRHGGVSWDIRGLEVQGVGRPRGGRARG
jgi:hypothetical protein